MKKAFENPNIIFKLILLIVLVYSCILFFSPAFTTGILSEETREVTMGHIIKITGMMFFSILGLIYIRFGEIKTLIERNIKRNR
ncbi:hypothetical protein CI105_07595 [Candidatus Izimaplasma bacterium ZiA1]|uniref:hypothetical protein n=1 Tax=Candidatus Izimoplasma sp. ZiA1 TaxID=2024899 RepID=UPI000BAA751A|nr:hypothetical protein CI105_07595 [Candidatus Izimaplasma bacterium ZiA1]